MNYKYLNIIFGIFLVFSVNEVLAYNPHKAVDLLFIDLKLESSNLDGTTDLIHSLIATKKVLHILVEKTPTIVTQHLLVNLLVYFILNEKIRYQVICDIFTMPDEREALMHLIGVKYVLDENGKTKSIFVGNITTDEEGMNFFLLTKFAWFYCTSSLKNEIKINDMTLNLSVSDELIQQVTVGFLGKIIPNNSSQHPLNIIFDNFPVILDFLAAIYMTTADFYIYDVLNFISVEVKKNLFKLNKDNLSLEDVTYGYFYLAQNSVINMVIFFWGILGQSQHFYSESDYLSFAIKSVLPLKRNADNLLMLMSDIFHIFKNDGSEVTIYPYGSPKLLLLQILHNFQISDKYSELFAKIFGNTLIFYHSSIDIKSVFALAFFLKKQENMCLVSYNNNIFNFGDNLISQAIISLLKIEKFNACDCFYLQFSWLTCDDILIITPINYPTKIEENVKKVVFENSWVSQTRFIDVLKSFQYKLNLPNYTANLIVCMTHIIGNILTDIVNIKKMCQYPNIMTIHSMESLSQGEILNFIGGDICIDLSELCLDINTLQTREAKELCLKNKFHEIVQLFDFFPLHVNFTEDKNQIVLLHNSHYKSMKLYWGENEFIHINLYSAHELADIQPAILSQLSPANSLVKFDVHSLSAKKPQILFRLYSSDSDD